MWLIQNFRKVKVITLTIFLYLISPLIIFSVVVLLGYRFFIQILAKINRKDLGGMINGLASLYASDELYGIPNRNLGCFLFLKGQLSLECLQKAIDRKILSVKDAKGSFQYRQLRLFATKFARFWFWKEEEEFNVEKHVVMYDKARDNNRIWTEQDLQEIQKNLIRKQWTRFASPWEILLLPNYRTQSCGVREVKTVLCVRFHMCIGNEVPWMDLLVKVLCEEGEGVSLKDPDVICMTPSSPKEFNAYPKQLGANGRSTTIVNIFGEKFRGKLENSLTSPSPSQAAFLRTTHKFGFISRRIFKRLVMPFRIPFDLAEQIMEPLSSTTASEWDVEDGMLLKRDHVVTLDRFAVEHVKEIKNKLGVSFTSVLISAMSAALRVTFIESGYKLPGHMKVMLPLSPKHGPSQTETLIGSDESFCCINLPLGVSSSRERLRLCESALTEVQDSTRLITNKILLSTLGLLPFKYHWSFLKKRPWTGVMMNFKGPKETLTLCDHQIEDVQISAASDSGFVLSFLSFQNSLRISLVIDHRLSTEAMAKNLLKNVYAELVLLGIEGAV